MLLFHLCLACGVVRAQKADGLALRLASAIAYDAAGNLYIADAASHRVLEATLGGTLLAVAGTGVQGFAGDGGKALNAELNEPSGLAVGSDGTLYIGDTGNQRIRAVSSDGVIRTIAGNGTAGFGGDGGSALSAQLRKPSALAVRQDGSLFFCDSANHRIRTIRAGIISTVVGTGVQGFAGDGGPATQAELDTPEGLAAAEDGRLFLADTHNNRVRLVTAEGVIRTLAGSGARGGTGDGQDAAAATLSGPRGLALLQNGTLLVADAGNQRVRAVAPEGVMTPLAGSGTEGRSSDGAMAATASLRGPRAVGVSSFGYPVLADGLNGSIRVLTTQGQLFAPAAIAGERTSQLSLPGAVTTTYGQGAVPVSVTGSVGTAQGSLTVADADALVGRISLVNGSGAASLEQLPAGVHSLAVTYLGDGLNPASQADKNLTVTVAQAPLEATAAAVSLPYGAALPRLAGSLTGVLPQDTGLVEAVFASSDGDMPAVGTHPIGVSLSGVKAANYSVHLGAGSGQLFVTKAGSVATLSAPSVIYAGLVTHFRATVASATQGQPGGLVQLLDGNSVLGQTTLQGGMADFALAVPLAGAHALAVQYAGDGNFFPSTSAAGALNVSVLPDFALAMAVPSATAAAGGSAHFSVVVRGEPGPFSGAVSFSLAGLPAGARVSFSPAQIVPGSASAPVDILIETAAATARTGKPWPGAWGAHAAVLAAGLVLLPCLRRRRSRLLLLLLTGPLWLSGCGARVVSSGSDGVLARTYTMQLTGTGTNLAGAVVTHSIPLSLTVQP